MKNSIDDETKYLFDRSYDVDLPEDEDEALLDFAKNQIKKYGWKSTFDSWKRYLFTQCTTPEAVINYANLFWCYDGCDHIIPDPYPFWAYFYYRIDMKTSVYDDTDILDGLAITILPKAGFKEANLMENPYYMPESDEELIAEVEKYKRENI